MSYTPERILEQKLRRWTQDSALFAREALGINELDPGQLLVLKDWDDPDVDRIAVVGATGTGKTRTEAIIVCHFLTCHGGSSPILHPKGVATAIDGKNMDMNLWPEIAKMIHGSPLMDAMFKWQAEKIFMKKHPATWFFEKRTWDAKATSGSQHTNALGLAGHHAVNSLFLVDESSGVPKAVLQSAERTLSTHKKGQGFCKIFQAGNPTHASGPLYDAANADKKLWNGGRGPVKLTSDPLDPNRCPRISKEWAQSQIDTYGRQDPFVQVYILAEFPTSSFNNFLGVGDVEEAMRRDHPPAVWMSQAPRAGIDVAYDGEDQTFVFPRQGLKAFEPLQLKVSLASATIGFDMANIYSNMHRTMEIEDVDVDATGGYGYALMEGLRQLGILSRGVKFNAKPSNDFFFNIRTEMYWRAALWVKKGGSLPDYPGLAEQATATTFSMKNGKMLAEPKEMVKKRLGKSPDMWDAFVLTFHTPDRVKKNVEFLDSQGRPIFGGTTQMQSIMDMNPLAEFKRPVDNGRKIVQGWGGLHEWKS